MTPEAPDRPRVVQLHPTRRCNLRCLHCYSASEPEAKGGLDLDVVKRAVDDAAALGFRTLSLSGGEPLLYGELPAVLEHARSAGLRTAVVSNGTVFGGGRLDAIAGLVDRLVVSIDGPPDLHNQVRASRWAFDRMVEGLAAIRAAGLPFGLLATVTNRSWPHLAWVGRFAAEQGAALLQLHAVEPVGRALHELADDVPDHDTLAVAYVVAAALRADYGDRMVVHADLLHRDHLEVAPELVYAADAAPVDPHLDPAGAIGVLAVEDDGTVSPFGYGFGRRFSVADLRHESLGAAWPRFAAERHEGLRALCRDVRAELLASEHNVFAWTEAVGRASVDASAPIPPGEIAVRFRALER